MTDKEILSKRIAVLNEGWDKTILAIHPKEILGCMKEARLSERQKAIKELYKEQRAALANIPIPSQIMDIWDRFWEEKLKQTERGVV